MDVYVCVYIYIYQWRCSMVPGYDHGVMAGQAAISKPHCGPIYIYIYHSQLSQTAWRVNALRGAAGQYVAPVLPLSRSPLQPLIQLCACMCVPKTYIFTTCICTTTTTTISNCLCSDDCALTLTLMKHPDRPDRSWRYAYLHSGLLSQTQRYEDGIEDAVVKNALRGPPAAGCPLSHSQQWQLCPGDDRGDGFEDAVVKTRDSGLLNQTPRKMMVLKMLW